MTKYFNTKRLAIAAIIAAVYIVLTLINPFSFGPIQCRVSEALTVLPIFFIEAIPGLFVGCLLSNLLYGAHWLDIVFGSLATLLAAMLTHYLKKNKYIAMLSPVVFNGVFVGIILNQTINAPLLETMAFVAIGEAVAVYLLGLPLINAINKTDLINKINN